MIQDAQLLFSDAQDVSSSAASTNELDLTTTENSTAGALFELGVGQELYFFIFVDTALAGSSTPSVAFHFVTDTAKPLDTSSIKLWSSPNFTTLTAGTLIKVKVPHADSLFGVDGAVDPYLQYLGFWYEDVGGVVTACNVTSGIVADVATDPTIQYASGLNLA